MPGTFLRFPSGFVLAATQEFGPRRRENLFSHPIYTGVKIYGKPAFTFHGALEGNSAPALFDPKPRICRISGPSVPRGQQSMDVVVVGRFANRALATYAWVDLETWNVSGLMDWDGEEVPKVPAPHMPPVDGALPLSDGCYTLEEFKAAVQKSLGSHPVAKARFNAEGGIVEEG